MSECNIFVLGLDQENLDTLRDVPHHERYRFHPLLSVPELKEGEIPVATLLGKAQDQLQAFKVSDDAQFAEAVSTIREGIGRIGGPFQYVLDQLDLPPEIAEVGGQVCLAEEALAGDQVATEGYVHRGEVVVYGVLDSIDYPGSSTFLRHQYPSQLPAEVVARLEDISKRVIAQVGLDNNPYSIEFFHDPDTGAINLLEVNPRHLVRRRPAPEEIEQLQREIPGVVVEPIPTVGQRLSDMPAQDSYSYELTDIKVGADDMSGLVDKYERSVAALR